MPQILLYDEKEMHVFEVVNYHPEEPLVEPVDIATIEQVQLKRAIFQDWKYQAEIAVGKVRAELDPTTMKRIAKYNLDRDFEEINKNIESAKSQLNALQEEISVKERKLSTINDVVKQIWEDECFDEGDYLFDKPQEDDYEESEDDWE